MKIEERFAYLDYEISVTKRIEKNFRLSSKLFNLGRKYIIIIIEVRNTNFTKITARIISHIPTLLYYSWMASIKLNQVLTFKK